MKSKISYDLHTHTTYSHGKGSIMDNARAAYEAGLITLGITDHGPGHMSYGLDINKIDDMRRDIDAAHKEFPELEILLGVEANIVNFSGNLDVSKEDQSLFDYIIAGYHYAYFGERFFHGLRLCVSGWLDDKNIIKENKYQVAQNTELIISALDENNIKILTHPGDKMPVNIEPIARACERTGTLLEINDHHNHLTTDEIKRVKDFNVSFILSSDAHITSRVGDVEGALQRARLAELDLNRIVNYRG